jgi:uncharacterized protein YkwD
MYRWRATFACTLMSMLLLVPGAHAMSRAERAVVKRVNKLRAQHGLRTLRGDQKLARAANAHSGDMLRNDFFAHNSSNGTSTYNRVRRYRRASLIGETLAYISGGSRPATVVRMWRNSPGHYAVMTNPRLRRIGVAKRRGVLWGQQVTMWTADFSSAH